MDTPHLTHRFALHRRALFCRVFFLCIVAAWVNLQPVLAESHPRQILIVVDKLAFEDFAEYPHATRHLQQLANNGAVGMMNVRTGGSANSASGYLTLAVGSRQQAGDWAANALMADEHIQGVDASLYYHGLTGKGATGTAIHLGIAPLLANDAFRHSLGAILAQHGFTVSLIGNSDSLGGRRRFGSLLATDQEGNLMGEFGPSVTTRDAEFPGGMRTDYQATLQRARTLADQSDLLIIDLGDLARLESAADITLANHYTAMRAQSLAQISSFVSTIVTDETFASVSITLLSPSPSVTLGRNGILITPVIEWTKDRSLPALLTSPTTRRAGIVTNGDFLPTILDRFDIATQGAAGRIWQKQPSTQPLIIVLDQYEKTKNVHLYRLPVIRPYFFGVLMLFFGGIAILARSFYLRSKGLDTKSLVQQQDRNASRVASWVVWWRIVLTLFVAFPLSLLLVSMASPMSLLGVATLIVATALSITVVSIVIEKSTGLQAIGVVATLTTIMLIADILARAPLMQGSLLGYDPVSGSRYYGIGNEYMGVLVGSALIAAGYVCDFFSTGDRWRGVLPTILLGLVTVIMLHPNLGINVGGAISAAFATASAFVFGRRTHISWKSGVAWSAAILGFVIAAALLDSHFAQDRASHLGQVVQSVGNSGTDPLWSLFGRKVATNMRLIRLTIWSRVVFVAVAVLAALLFYPNWLATRLGRAYPALKATSKAAFVAALAALVVNDSGVVAAATMLLWPMFAILSIAPTVSEMADSRDISSLDNEVRA